MNILTVFLFMSAVTLVAVWLLNDKGSMEVKSPHETGSLDVSEK